MGSVYYETTLKCVQCGKIKVKVDDAYPVLYCVPCMSPMNPIKIVKHHVGGLVSPEEVYNVG